MRKTIKNEISQAPEEKIEFIFSTPTDDNFDEYIKSPMENAEEALENLKAQLSADTDENAYIKYINDIYSKAVEFEKVDFTPQDFTWYRITNVTPLADISCFSHILHNQGAISAFSKHGYYLLGLKDNILCFALPAEKDAPNPIRHIDDCTVYTKAHGKEFCTVCVSLEPDGQYFIKY